MSKISRLLESLFDLMESKDHLIKKLKNLSPQEKGQVIEFFKKKPNLEGKIDWNNRKLTFSDFSDVMSTTKTERKKKVKKSGISGLKKNKDYVELDMPTTDYKAYIPLNWEASKLLAGRRIGGVEGKWCIAYQKDRSYWKDYIYKRNLTPIYFIKDGDKYAVMIKSAKVSSVWNKADTEVGIKGIKALGYASKTVFEKELKKNSSQTRKARKILDENVPLNWLEEAIAKGTVKVKDAKFHEDEEGDIVWDGGIWIDGTWEDGEWKGGVWEKGIFEDGLWMDGIWEDGEFKGIWYKGVWKAGIFSSGIWKSGIWKSGIWKNGDWNDGEWQNGTWEEGIWYNGTWENGIWLGGTWEKGTINGKPSTVHP